MSKIKLSENFIKDRVKLALTEDLYPYGDITSNLINNNKIIEAKIISNQKAVVAGLLFVKQSFKQVDKKTKFIICLLYTSPSPRDVEESRMPSSA